MMRPEISVRTLRVLGKSISEAFLVPFKDIPRVLFHGLILSFIIAGFWLLDSLKDPVLAATVGIEYQPIAKFFSVCTTLLVVCIYDYLTSVVSKPTLFHIVSCVFGVAMMIMAGLLGDSDTGLAMKKKDPSQLLGWISYVTIEAYGSLMVALFWSFTNSIMDLEQAKGAYGLILSIAQIGTIMFHGDTTTPLPLLNPSFLSLIEHLQRCLLTYILGCNDRCCNRIYVCYQLWQDRNCAIVFICFNDYLFGKNKIHPHQIVILSC